MSINSLPFLYFKGNSSLEFNLFIKSKGSYNAPSRDKTFETVAGRNGDLIRDNGRYNNVNIPYDLTLVKTDVRNFTDLCRSIKTWLLAESGYFRLWDSYNAKYFRLASYDGSVDITEELRNIGEFSASFNCKPFQFLFEGQEIVTITEKDSGIYNPEAFPSKPYIKIYGSGDLTLNINNAAYNFTAVSEYIEIDTEAMSAYKADELQNHKMTSIDFPELQPGNNNISWAGSVSKVEIIPRWCTL